MLKGIGVVGLYVHDQDEALDFYVNKLGLRVHADHRNGNYRWLTVKHPNQPGFELGLFLPQEPVLDGATAQTMREMVAKGAMPPLVFVVEDCRASHKALSAKGVEFTQEPVARYGSVDALPRSFWQWLEDDPGTLVMCGHYIHPIAQEACVSTFIRAFHRWTSLAFALVVALIFALLGLGLRPAQWLYYVPLLPLSLLLLTGLYMFFLPYAAKMKPSR